MRTTTILPAAALALVLAATSACTSGPVEADPGPVGRDGPRAPWPETFRTRALLVADEVRVEGPKGLLEHFVLRPDPAAHELDVETVPQGLRQVVRLLPDVPQVEIRSYLDQWELVAMRRLVVLERPGDVPVVVTASGEAFLHDLEAGTETRQPSLRVVGR